MFKLQYGQPWVEYLGRIIACGTRVIAPSQLQGINKVSKPMIVGQVMTFLGMKPLKWTLDPQVAFETLKQDVQTAPALTRPDYSQPFHLYVGFRCDESAKSGVLMQDTYNGWKIWHKGGHHVIKAWQQATVLLTKHQP